MGHSLTARIAQIRGLIEQGAIARKELISAVENPLVPEMFPTELWAMIAFVQHERRQKWVGYIVESRLRGDGVALAHLGAFAHTDDDESQESDVPDEPGWKYYFHGRGCCFVHDNGTEIDVDSADDGSSLEIDPFFYGHFLDSVAEPTVSERQLRHGNPYNEAWQVDLLHLSEQKCITVNHRFRLTNHGRELGELLESVVDHWDRCNASGRLLICCLIGDFNSGLHESAELLGLESLNLASLASHQNQKRAQFLRALRLDTESRFDRSALEAIGLLGFDLAGGDVISALRHRPVTGLNHTALSILNEWRATQLDELVVESLTELTAGSWLQEVRSFFVRKVSRDGDRPRQGLVISLMRSLFQRHTRSRLPQRVLGLLRHALEQDYYAVDDEAAFFLYLLDEPRGLARLEAVLASPVPAVRTGAACFLALIAGEPSIDILIRVAGGPPENGGHEAACALSLISNDRAQSAATHWQRRFDGYEDPGEGRPVDVAGKSIRVWSVDDLQRANCRGFVLSWFDSHKSGFLEILKTWRTR